MSEKTLHGAVCDYLRYQYPIDLNNKLRYCPRAGDAAKGFRVDFS